MSTPSAGALRMGVEEEFLLADRATRVTVPRARTVVRDAAKVLGGRALFGFLQTQAGACTRPVATAGELRAELVAMRRALVHAAAQAGCLLVASGTAVLPSRHPLRVTGTERFRRVAAHAGRDVWDQVGGELCGCHVHLGDLPRGEALALSAHLRPWLPALQAACVNSPFCEGEETGAASTGWSRRSAWPTFGPAPLLDEDGYEWTAGSLVADRVVLDRRMIQWLIRPSDEAPALEARIADTNADVDVSVFLAVVLRGLSYVLLDEHRAGLPPPAVSTGVLRKAHAQAAAVGLTGIGRHPVTGRVVPASAALDALLERAAPGLDRAGDLHLARALEGKLLARGTGAAGQRATFVRRRSLPAVVDHLAHVTAQLTPSRAVVTLPAL
ncbi:glutamate-cysteine ligase family protein [Kitasatospora sp. NPDC051914]|uniref:carboxylate-amine ligase n=1 Tax=Kitasatospora sp. NPDC051914 TaxID=3154945 RepID=UPI003446FC6C